jgi:hypothetical protein
MAIRFVAGTEDGQVICFDELGRVQWIVRVGKGTVSNLYASTRGSILAVTTGGALGRIAEKGDKGQLVTRKTNEERSYVQCLEIGEQVIAATDDGRLFFCDGATLESGDEVDTSVPITAIGFSGEQMYYASGEGGLYRRSAFDPSGKATKYRASDDPAEITSLVVRGDHVFALLSSGAIDAYSMDDPKKAPERAFDDAVRCCPEAESNVVAIDGEGSVWRINQGLASAQIGRIELEDMIVQPAEEGSVLATCRFDGHADLWKIAPGSLKKQGSAGLKAEITCLAGFVSKAR